MTAIGTTQYKKPEKTAAEIAVQILVSNSGQPMSADAQLAAYGEQRKESGETGFDNAVGTQIDLAQTISNALDGSDEDGGLPGLPKFSLANWPGVDPKVALEIESIQAKTELFLDQYEKENANHEAWRRAEDEIAWAKNRIRRKKFLAKILKDELKQLQKAMSAMSLLGMRIPPAMMRRARALEAMINRLKQDIGAEEVQLQSKISNHTETPTSMTSIGADGSVSAGNTDSGSSGGESSGGESGGADLADALGGGSLV